MTTTVSLHVKANVRFPLVSIVLFQYSPSCFFFMYSDFPSAAERETAVYQIKINYFINDWILGL